MSEFKEINPFKKENKGCVREEPHFIESTIGDRYMKLEFGRKQDVNVNRTIEFAEKTEL